MSPEGVNTLSISADVRGNAIVIHLIGELDYDYAPILRRELTQAWSLGAGNLSSSLTPPSTSSGLPAPPSIPAPPLLPETSLLSGTPLLTETPLLSESPLPPKDPHPSGPPPPLSPETPSPFFPGSPPPPSPGSPPPIFPEEPPPLPPDTPPSNGPSSIPTMTLPFPPPPAPSSLDASPEARAEAAPRLILNLEGLTFCDSTGLAELLWILRKSQETRTRLVLAGASRTLRHMMAVTGLLAHFTMVASLETALSGEENGATEGH